MLPPSNRLRRFGAWLLLLAALALPACNKDVGSPEVAAQRFFTHVQRRDAEAIWKSLSKASQEALRARHAELAEATGDPTDPKAMVEHLGLTALGETKTPVVVSPLGDRVTVRLSGPRGSTDLHLVREGPAWKVDLMRALAPSVADEDS